MAEKVFGKYKSEEYDEYIEKKLIFINSSESYSKNTKQLYLRLFDNYTHSLEVAKGKDLYDFDRMEIVHLIKSAPTTSKRTKKSLFSAINSYISWACDRGFNQVGNPCDTIKVTDILDLNEKALRESYYDLDFIYRYIELAYTTRSITGVLAQELIVLLLIRYGLTMDEAIELKNSDIDRDNLCLKIYNEKGLKNIPIDNQFLKWIDIFSGETEFYKVGKGDTTYSISYAPSEYVLKNTNTDKANQPCVKSAIYTRFDKIFIKINSTISKEENVQKLKEMRTAKISLGDLQRSRKIDLLLEIFEKKGYVGVEDCEEVLKIFTLKTTYGKIYNLRDDFELITEIKVRAKL